MSGAGKAVARGQEPAPQLTEDDRLSLLAEGLATGWRKGTDGPLANQIHKMIHDMDPRDWGEYVRWVDWALGEVGYRPRSAQREEEP